MSHNAGGDNGVLAIFSYTSIVFPCVNDETIIDFLCRLQLEWINIREQNRYYCVTQDRKGLVVLTVFYFFFSREKNCHVHN